MLSGILGRLLLSTYMLEPVLAGRKSNATEKKPVKIHTTYCIHIHIYIQKYICEHIHVLCINTYIVVE